MSILYCYKNFINSIEGCLGYMKEHYDEINDTDEHIPLKK